MPTITYFDDFEGPNPYGFLSNFYVDPIVQWRTIYKTGEHLFQACKARTKADHDRIVAAPTPGSAKRLGRTCALRPDWERVKYDVMRMTVSRKFTYGSDLAEALLQTGDALLVEGNTWHDRVWGATQNSSGGYDGRNWLGFTLMGWRAELRAAESLGPGLVNAVAEFARPVWMGRAVTK